MKNPLKKFFRKQVKLTTAERPPLKPQTEEETRAKIEGLRQRLADLNREQDRQDWTVEDRQLVQRLEKEQAELEHKLAGDSIERPEGPVANQLEDPEVKSRIDNLMKKVRG